MLFMVKMAMMMTFAIDENILLLLSKMSAVALKYFSDIAPSCSHKYALLYVCMILDKQTGDDDDNEEDDDGDYGRVVEEQSCF